MATPYLAGRVNHARTMKRQRLWPLHIWLVRSTMPRWMKRQRLLTILIRHMDSITDCTHFGTWTTMDREERLRRRREQYRVRQSRETAEEREKESKGWKQGEHVRDVGIP